jgi:hypothetical protein
VAGDGVPTLLKFLIENINKIITRFLVLSIVSIVFFVSIIIIKNCIVDYEAVQNHNPQEASDAVCFAEPEHRFGEAGAANYIPPQR